MASIQITTLARSEASGRRSLSPVRERFEVGLASVTAAVTCLGCMGLAAAWVLGSHRAVWAPGFFLVWAGMAGLATWLTVRRARREARSFRIGPGVDADGFSDAESTLVERVGPGYELRLLPGMRGSLIRGRHPVPIEALTAEGPARLPLVPGARIEVRTGGSTFLVSASAEPGPGALARPPDRRGSLGLVRRGLRTAAMAVPAAALVTLVSSTPVAAPASMPARYVSWRPREVAIESTLRHQAEPQTEELRRCFRGPPACHAAGLVRLLLKIDAEGTVERAAVLRSTFGAACPVDACVTEVASHWRFEPPAGPAQVVLPVEVAADPAPRR